MIIMYVRHADDKNDVLTELGKQQCEMLEKYEEEYKFTKIYSSPAKRCVDTAKALSKKFGIPVEIRKDLNERETLNGDPKTKKEQLWFDNYLNPEFSSKKPEGCKEYFGRIFSEIDGMINEHFDKEENVIIVAHSGTSYAISSYFYGVQKGKDVPWMRVGNCSRIYFEVNKKV